MKKILFMSFIAILLGIAPLVHAGNAYTISGSVKDSSTNQGIPAATVTVRNGSNAAVATISTDQAGNYTATVATAGDYYASAVKAGYDDFSPPPYPVEISVTSPAAVFNMVLTPAGAPPATLSLAPGWNFISFPKDPSPNNSVAAVLKEVSPSVRIVWGYDNAAKWWLKYKPGVADPTLTRIESGLGYWMYMDASGTVTMTNWAAPPVSITLNPAWNLVGYNGPDNTAFSAALNSVYGNYSIIWNWTSGDWFAHPSDSRLLPIPDLTVFDQKKAYWIYGKAGGATWTWSSQKPSPDPSGASMNTDQTVSDQAQSMTIAFDGLAFVTGSFCAQTFYPPGKVADFFGFQYLRDNDLSGMGHNTDFTTLTADPILVLLNDAQLKILSDLGTAEAALNDNYGYARFPLAKAFRRLNDGDLPAGKTGLSRDAVKAFSAYLFSIDGEMSYLRAKAYASVLGSMDTAQQAILAAMKGKGSLQWTQPTQAQIDAVLARYPGQMMRTYAGEMLAWYLGNIDADVYFCPERQGTYFGSFFMKDIKAMNNPSYTIDSNMTADMGDAFLAALDTTQKAKVTGLVTEQKTDLLSIVSKRDEISKTLRNFLSSGGTVDKAAVISLARQYGELDGDISYLYATRFSSVGTSLTSSQKSTLTALRKTATAETGGTPDYDNLCGNGYLYSAPLKTPTTVMNTDFMFGVCGAAGSSCSTNWDCCSFSCGNNVCGSAFTLTSSAFVAGGSLPSQYTCDGSLGMLSHNPPLAWTGAPSGTVTFALTISTIALDGTKWNWVLYNIPNTVSSLAEATTLGTAGVSTDGPDLRYYPPCSTGPGEKTYTFTLYALSGTPTFFVPVTGDILTSTISPLILGSSQVNVTYTRTGI